MHWQPYHRAPSPEAEPRQKHHQKQQQQQREQQQPAAATTATRAQKYKFPNTSWVKEGGVFLGEVKPHPIDIISSSLDFPKQNKDRQAIHHKAPLH